MGFPHRRRKDPKPPLHEIVKVWGYGLTPEEIASGMPLFHFAYACSCGKTGVGATTEAEARERGDRHVAGFDLL